MDFLYSHIPNGFPNYGIAQGSIFTILGFHLAEDAGCQGVPLQPEFLGMKIDITVNGVTTHALPYYVSRGALTAILSSKTPAGDGIITVTSGGLTSSRPIHVVPSAFGLLTLPDANVAVVQNMGMRPRASRRRIEAVSSNEASELLSQTNAANAGEYLALWGSGLGPVPDDETQYQTPSDLTNIPVEVDIGGVSATVTYHGRSVYPGLDQIHVIVPPGVSGCYVSVVVVAGGVPSNFATIPVASSGRICSDPALMPVAPDEYQRLSNRDHLNIGMIALDTVTTAGPVTGAAANDSVYALMQKYTGPELTSAGLLLQPSAGSCIVFYDRSGIVAYTGGPHPYFRWANFPQLNAGPQINVKGPDGTLALAPIFPGAYYWYPPGTPPPIVPPTGGSLTFDNGQGGPDVGPFTASLSLTPPMVWTNRSAITAVNRSNGQLVTWTGGIPGSYVTIFGYSFADLSTNLKLGYHVYTDFTCSAPVSAGQFTVPAAVLESLLPSGAVLVAGNLPGGNGYLYVVNGTTQRFSAPGIDLGLLFFSAGSGISVPFN